jgi:hypothetical protein
MSNLRNAQDKILSMIKKMIIYLKEISNLLFM